MSWKFLASFALLFGLVSTIAVAAEHVPTAQESAVIDRLTGEYFRALDAGEYDKAYAMQTPELQAMAGLSEWSAYMRDEAKTLGRPLSRKQAKLTWYLDPPNSPRPGLYVAVDFQSTYANAQQGSEYVIWFRGHDEFDFRLMRHEQNFMHDAAKGKAAEPDPLPESDANAIGYATVEEARKALTSRKDAEVRPMQEGWLVVNTPADNAIWTFTPAGHPAYPAVVKRFWFEKNGSMMMGMTALCQAAKEPCDALMRDFQELNQKMAEEIKNKK
ncbi:DUF4019 domain-containing protein [Arenimonas sp.]|uniref:DUF4019 domain-containing protein n=1 Tax=Arenimonas sp. TaxID=1872635 RepID=UPI0039E72477